MRSPPGAGGAADAPGDIARLWRGVTASGSDADAYHVHLTTGVLPSLTRIPGYRGAKILRRSRANDVEFVVMTLWTSMDAIRAFAGEDPEPAVVEPEARAVLIEYDETVRHYSISTP